MLDQLHIDVPFLEGINQMPTYAKFLKDIITKNRKIERYKTVATAGEYFLVDIPPKKNDLGSFIISCSIGDNYVGKASCDRGSSVNLMPKSVFMKLGMGTAKPTTVVLQLADRSHVRPEGKLEDLLVKVGKFVFPVDFLILDCEADHKAPIILGQPFLATGRILIDCEKGGFAMRVGDQTMTINVYNTIRYMDNGEECQSLQDSVATATADDTELCYNSSIQIEDFMNLQEENQEEVDDLPFQEQQIKPFIPRSGMEFESLDFTEFVPLKSSLEISPSLELKPLPSHLKYVSLGANDTLPVIISSQLNANQELSVVNLLDQYKKAIGWTMADLKGISPTICMHKILLDECHNNSMELQRRLNPAMKKVVMKEIIKWLDVGSIYPISDSSWVSPIQCVPKKGGMTVVTNEANELLPTRTVTGWRIYGYSGYNQIVIAPEDQEKTTLTCSYGTYAFRRMPFGLCNAPTTFQRCMLAIFSDMVEDYLDVFMDDFSVSGDNFDTCLGNLAKVLKRCEESDLVLNWEKCHFMVTEGTVLGHKISSQGIEVDKAKVEVIEKLSPPTTIKGIRSFLGHASFYRRFIKDFSKISKPMCNLLQKNQSFVFDEDCQSALKELKKSLISAPIVVPPDWTSPFELMCDASDYAVGAALGQRQGKLFHVIYYASRTLNDAQVNYTTTKKELLAVVFAFDKFRSYLIGTKQEFDLEIKDRKGIENQIADLLYRLENKSECENNIEIKEKFPDEKILSATAIPWYADIVNFLVSGVLPHELSSQGRKKFRHDARYYFWDEPYLFK
ncbi:hypothetical protein V6N11_025615 [Hibiscus sabdariffa]|uniref:Reverse transcriptase n=1 Tax=Hibiscus sabdariffa TaxID=183260 RepID=A0ABR2ST70_9ROSI